MYFYLVLASLSGYTIDHGVGPGQRVRQYKLLVVEMTCLWNVLEASCVAVSFPVLRVDESAYVRHPHEQLARLAHILECL